MPVSYHPIASPSYRSAEHVDRLDSTFRPAPSLSDLFTSFYLHEEGRCAAARIGSRLAAAERLAKEAEASDGRGQAALDRLYRPAAETKQLAAEKRAARHAAAASRRVLSLRHTSSK